jgi:hypothetical protein
MSNQENPYRKPGPSKDKIPDKIKLPEEYIPIPATKVLDSATDQYNQNFKFIYEHMEIVGLQDSPQGTDSKFFIQSITIKEGDTVYYKYFLSANPASPTELDRYKEAIKAAQKPQG